MRTTLSLILLTLILTCYVPQGLAAPASCIDWPRVMTQYELDGLPEGRTVIVHSFTNGTKKSSDEWLVAGLRDFLTDLLRAAKDMRVVSGLSATYGGGTPAYSVGGKFQHLEKVLRIFISINEGSSGKLLKQFEVVCEYPNNKDFFRQLGAAAREMLKFMKAKYSNEHLKAIAGETESTRAFESYSKGLQAFETYNPKSMEMAKTWFTEAKKFDYRSPLGYEGLIDLYTFLGFYNKQRGLSYGSYYQKAQNELLLMKRLANPEPLILPRKNTKVTKKKKGKPPEITNRFLASNIDYSEGLFEEKQGNWSKAAAAFKRACETVPEDAASWKHLAQMESKVGNVQASRDALAKAAKIDPCMGGAGITTPVTAPTAPGKSIAPAAPQAPAPTKPVAPAAPATKAKDEAKVPHRWQ